MCRYDDSDGWDFFHEEQRRAAKDHPCGECRRTITKGETYRYSTGLFDGYWSTFRTCAHCQEATRWLIVACSGWMFEEVQEDLLDHVTGDEWYLRTRPLTRLVRWMTADWRNRAGELRPLEDVKLVTDEAIEAYRKMENKAA